MAFQIRRPATAFSLDPTSKETKRVLDPKHIAFVKKLPSILSGQYGCDPCHIRSGCPERGKHRTGGGQRPSDQWILPMTRSEHDAQHARGDELAFYRENGIDDPFGLALAIYGVSGNEEAAIAIIRAHYLARKGGR